MANQVVLLGTTGGLVCYTQNDSKRWQREGMALAGRAVQALLPVDAGIVLANVEGESFASTDRGATWQPSSNVAPAPVEMRVATANGPRPLANPRLSGATAYARLALKSPMLLGAGAGGIMLFRSSDDGIHWEPAGMSEMVGRIATIVPGSDSAEAAWAGSDQGALLRSGDGGKTWRVLAREPAAILCLAAVGLGR